MSPDAGALLDMLLAAREAIELTTGLTQEAFAASVLHQRAITKTIENIGEAARAISTETRAATPNIQWAEIIAMRNALIHEYFRIDLVKVWRTIQHDLPQLITELQRLIPSEE